jgi:hypothetical protein
MPEKRNSYSVLVGKPKVGGRIALEVILEEQAAVVEARFI